MILGDRIAVTGAEELALSAVMAHPAFGGCERALISITGQHVAELIREDISGAPLLVPVRIPKAVTITICINHENWIPNSFAEVSRGVVCQKSHGFLNMTNGRHYLYPRIGRQPKINQEAVRLNDVFMRNFEFVMLAFVSAVKKRQEPERNLRVPEKLEHGLYVRKVLLC